jgi:glycosyltransferase involved in cell wall biosynthesis
LERILFAVLTYENLKQATITLFPGTDTKKIDITQRMRENKGSMKLSILMPVFNEIQSIAAVVRQVNAVALDKEIILVNDASTDGTADLVNKFASNDLKVIHHVSNQGKGAAIRTALKAATGDVIVIQDADFEYDPGDLPRLMAPITEGKAAVVYGVRSLEGQKLIMRWGNRFITFLTNMLYGQSLNDVETCYKMMWRDIALVLGLECRRFDIETEITAKLLRSGYTIYEMPISYGARYVNKKLSPLDGLPALRTLLRFWRWKPPAQYR